MGVMQSALLELPEATAVMLKINGREFTVPDNLPANTSLNTFIREHAHLTGTKFMCLEGGCGACIVSVRSAHPSTGKEQSYSVNSCMVPIYACHGWSVTTIEGLGGKAKGYHAIQKRLAAAGGTQCGYCSPGMVMNMNSLLEANPKITMKEVENSFGGNICRCTGYRPILDAFKSLASDATPDLTRKLADIEDMMCPKSGQICTGASCGQSCSETNIEPKTQGSIHVALKNGSQWLKPSSIQEVFQIFDMIGDKSYRLVGGNTGQGVYRIENEPQVWIDLNGIGDLHSTQVTPSGIILGANISLTEAMHLFYKTSAQQPKIYSYLKVLADHIDLIANVPVRNVGTIGGNLAMKHDNPAFPSDIFLILETFGARLILREVSGIELELTPAEFVKRDINKKLLTKINLPVYDDSNYIYRSFKIMPRAQNAHAYVNAGFLAKVDKKDRFKVLEKPNVLFGGIEPNFLHAGELEDFLVGKKLVDQETIKGALAVLDRQLSPDHVLPDASPAFRKGLAQSLLYKFIISVNPSAVADRYKSGGDLLSRPVSNAKQDFDTDRNLWPLNKPIPKLEALIQCAGEAEYSNDIPAYPGQLYAQIVLTDRFATVAKIDFTQATGIPGVWGYYTAKDIPGKNSFVFPNPSVQLGSEERIFCPEGEAVEYAGQAVAVVLADSHATAIEAAKRVKITYSNEKKPMIDARQIIKNGLKDRIKQVSQISPTASKTDIKHKIKGHWDVHSQYHYTMETHTTFAMAVEDHLEVYPSTQSPSTTQSSISYALDIPENNINIRVRRLGGGYGSKLSRGNHVAVVAAICAYLSRKPVKFVLQLENTMRWAGKRFPVLTDYEAGVNDNGEIQYLNVSMWQDNGYCANDSAMGVGTFSWIKNIYDSSTWSLSGYEVTTDTASNTWCRSPGSLEAIAAIETIMDHIARVVGKDPIQVRLANLDKVDSEPIPAMIDDTVQSANYLQRLQDVEKFNKENRWKKRGISLVPMNYPFAFWGGFHGLVAIFGTDGTVAVTHGAIEMGQGVNTKVAQVVAYTLGIDVELISVKPTINNVTPNDSPTGGSIGSEAVSYAVKMCCDQLNERLALIKKQLGPKATWKEITNAALNQNIDLLATYQFTPRDLTKSYFIYGVTIAEVEVDILTGQIQIKRVDLHEDAGQSLSPEVDVGQVEGAFIMGAGYFTSEEIVLDPNTGLNLTDRTWNYKPPGAKDIPVDFRVTLRKKSDNPFGVLRSKATGEPPLCMSVSITNAIRNALISARKDAGISDTWLELDPPYTAEKIWLAASTTKEQMVIT